MADVDMKFPQRKQKEVFEPVVQRTEKYLKSKENFSTDKYKLTVPDGKYAKVTVKIIVNEISKEEYNNLMGL